MGIMDFNTWWEIGGRNGHLPNGTKISFTTWQKTPHEAMPTTPIPLDYRGSGRPIATWNTFEPMMEFML